MTYSCAKRCAHSSWCCWLEHRRHVISPAYATKWHHGGIVGTRTDGGAGQGRHEGKPDCTAIWHHLDTAGVQLGVPML